jgi:hypothetical protein
LPRMSIRYIPIKLTQKKNKRPIRSMNRHAFNCWTRTILMLILGKFPETPHLPPPHTTIWQLQNPNITLRCRQLHFCVFICSSDGQILSI